jgi:hypothetical protein
MSIESDYQQAAQGQTSSQDQGFWSKLGHGLEDYALSRYRRSPLGRIANSFRPGSDGDAGMPQTAPDVNDPHMGALDTQIDPGQAAFQPGSTVTGTPAAPINTGLPMPIPMAAGKIVTQPTNAVLGEKGPEAVVPLETQPGMKTGSGILGQGNLRTRWSHPKGPVASARVKPITADIPVRPNVAQR